MFYPFSLSVPGKEYQLYGLPFSFDLLLLSGFFFILGNEVRQLSSEKTFNPILLLIGTGAGLLLLNFFFPYSTDIAKRVYESSAINTIEAILGILFVLALSRQIELHIPQLATPLKYTGNITLIILLFHVPIQGFWGEKIMALTNNFPLSILIGFIMGILGTILLYEISSGSIPWLRSGSAEKQSCLRQKSSTEDHASPLGETGQSVKYVCHGNPKGTVDATIGDDFFDQVRAGEIFMNE